ncbi:MAG: WHG domain-containing protein [Myxococcales bacterium]|nr:WHG domain-containing protein [Myxococcales bacterium]
MPRPKQRDSALKAQLLLAAKELLATEGSTAVTARAVARAAGTSVPAVYELFGAKEGVVRELFFDGFGSLGQALETPQKGVGRPIDDLFEMLMRFRRFSLDNAEMTKLMFGRAFVEFELSSDELAAGTTVRNQFISRVEDCIADGSLGGNPVDIGHALLALVQGLAAQESAGWLGSSAESVERRWRVAVGALLAGFRAD